MKKISLLLPFFLLILRGVSVAQNPYESLGKTTDVLTLSNGKYQEFMNNDTTVQIGSVLFNTITNEVVYFVETDSFRLMDADLTTRFLSVDPLGRKYPQLTPYQFASNTPLQAIDLDGLEGAQITINYWKNSNGETVQEVKEDWEVANPNPLYGSNGLLTEVRNLDNGEVKSDYTPDVVIVGTRIKPFAVNAQEKLTTLFSPIIKKAEKGSNLMRHAAAAGIGVQFKGSIGGLYASTKFEGYGLAEHFERRSTGAFNTGAEIGFEYNFSSKDKMSSFAKTLTTIADNFSPSKLFNQTSLSVDFYIHANTKKAPTVGFSYGVKKTAFESSATYGIGVMGVKASGDSNGQYKAGVSFGLGKVGKIGVKAAENDVKVGSKISLQFGYSSKPY